MKKINSQSIEDAKAGYAWFEKVWAELALGLKSLGPIFFSLDFLAELDHSKKIIVFVIFHPTLQIKILPQKS